MSETPRHARTGWLTLLFVPADKPGMLRKAQTRGASALVIDLEDAVASDRKEAARHLLCEELAAGALDGRSRVYVRINPPTEGGIDDAEALTSASVIAGLMVPKAARPEQLAQISETLGDNRQQSLIPQIETAEGLLGLPQLLKADDRLAAVAFGGEDFAADLGVPRSTDSVELLFPRAWLAVCARAAGLPAIDTVFAEFENVEGLRREAALAAQLGFAGKLLIHPAQIEPVEEAFAPSPNQVEWANRVLTAAAEASRRGTGVATVKGAMVDAPVIAQAERIVARKSATGGGA